VLVIAGFKEFLWPATLERVGRFAPADADVCLLSAGIRLPELAALAERFGWSYLSTDTRFVGTAQNLAIGAHPSARYIHKLDEDIMVADGHFERLLDRYERIQREREVQLGFLAPLMNVNGFSYVDFLEHVGAREDYEARFGPATRASGGIPIHSDGDAARFVWERSLPLDEVARDVAQRPFGYRTVPFKFSIGDILFERSLWEEMDGFRRGWIAPGLGIDEEHLCTHCVVSGKVMAVADDVFAGHIGYGQQMGAMCALYDAQPARFA